MFDENTMADMLGLGHSRIPVYRGADRNNITGGAPLPHSATANTANAVNTVNVLVGWPNWWPACLVSDRNFDATVHAVTQL